MLDLNEGREAAHLRSQSEYGFVRDDSGILVELQWDILPRHFSFGLDPSRLWECLEFVSFEGKKVHSFAPEDLLLILCVHGSKHHWERLSLICDVAELVRVHQGINWEWVMKRAVSSGGKRMLFLGLSLAAELLGTTLPGEVSKSIEVDSALKSLSREVYKRLFGGVEARLGALESSLFHLRVRE